jgi:glycosyltransferase involved in cell wall biosynthesis
MNNRQIFVSVITPVFNSKEFLSISLPAIRKSDYPYFEFIVVDDNSTDGSGEFAKQYADSVIRMKNKVAPGKARNKGVQVSKGEILIFVDADVLVMPDSISSVVKLMKDNPQLQAVFGSYDDSPYFKNFFSQYKNLHHHFVHQNANPQSHTFWAGFGAIRREAFLSAGGFPEKYSTASIEDIELGYKLTESGKKIRLAKELQVKHLKKWDFISLLKSDIIHRALPWTRLAYERGLPRDLNFRFSDRISGLIACLLPLSLILMWWEFWFAFLFLVFAGMLICLNIKLYKFFFQKKGIWFMGRAVCFHWFYLVYSSVTYLVFSLYLLLKNIFHRK